MYWTIGARTLRVEEFDRSYPAILMGPGIPLFDTIPETIYLDLIEHKVYSNGVVVLHYRVGRKVGAASTDQATRLAE